MSSSNCCFLTCLQISQEAGQVVWYSHIFQNFPQFIVIHTVTGFGIVNKAEIDVFLELSCFFYDPAIYYLAFKKNTFELVLMRWMKLEPIIQSEGSQKEKHQQYINIYIWNLERL